VEETKMRGCRLQPIVASLSLLLAALLAAPVAASESILPPNCELSGGFCPGECSPSFQLDSRMVTSINFIRKKDNDVCVYECTANDTFHDFAQCPGSQDFTTPVTFRVRIFAGAFPCPTASPAFCCDTDPQPNSCSW
jgi:hypothetical protein